VREGAGEPFGGFRSRRREGRPASQTEDQEHRRRPAADAADARQALDDLLLVHHSQIKAGAGRCIFVFAARSLSAAILARDNPAALSRVVRRRQDFRRATRRGAAGTAPGIVRGDRRRGPAGELLVDDGLREGGEGLFSRPGSGGRDRTFLISRPRTPGRPWRRGARGASPPPRSVRHGSHDIPPVVKCPRDASL